MNNKDKIILYLDSRMTPDEKAEFEGELKNSPELSGEMERIKRSLQILKELNFQPSDESYFLNNIPLFRERLERKQKISIHKKIIYASSAAVILILAVSLFLFNDTGTIPAGGALTELSDEQLDNLAGRYNVLESASVLNAVPDSVWQEIMIDEFSFSYEDADSILFSFNGDADYAGYLSDEEEAFVYDDLVNKEIF